MTCPPQVWDGVLRRLADHLPAPAFEAWIGPLVPEFGDAGLRLVCESDFHRDRVRDRHLPQIVEAVEHEHGERLPVRLEVRRAPRTDLRPAPTRRAAAAAPAAETECLPEARPRPVRAPAHRPRAFPGPARPAAPRRAPARRDTLPYSFDSFVVGPGNALAREACLALAQGRQLAVCALYLVGGSGLGKTHLATAVVNEAGETGQRARYVSAEQFTSELMGSIRERRTAEFKQRYREDCDVLVMEDIQFLRGKRATQLELFHTLEHLERTGRRVVLTAERLPREIPGLEERLVSRLVGGLCAEIEAPDAALRREILRAKAAAGGVGIPADCIDRLLEAVPGSVRELEGVLIQLVTSASLLKRPIDLELVEAALRKVGPPCGGRGLDPERVVEVVASYFRTTPEKLASRSRRREVLVPRQLAMYLCSRYTDASLKRIGRSFGRNHPSVANAIQAVERAVLERAPLRYQLEALSARLEGGPARPSS